MVTHTQQHEQQAPAFPQGQPCISFPQLRDVPVKPYVAGCFLAERWSGF